MVMSKIKTPGLTAQKIKNSPWMEDISQGLDTNKSSANFARVYELHEMICKTFHAHIFL